MPISGNTADLNDVPLPGDLVFDTFDHAMDIASHAFLHDTFQNFLTRTYLGLKSEDVMTVDHHRKAMNTLFPPFLESGGFLVTSPQAPTATTIWEVFTPTEQAEFNADAAKGKAGPPPPSAIVEISRVSGPVWRAEFPNGQRVLHLALVGNTATADKPASSSSSGASSSTQSKPKPKGAGYIIQEMCQAAKALGLPVVLESTSPKSRDVYAKRGFQLVAEVRAGVGMADKTGNTKEGGEGFPLYMMKYV